MHLVFNYYTIVQSVDSNQIAKIKILASLLIGCGFGQVA